MWGQARSPALQHHRPFSMAVTILGLCLVNPNLFVVSGGPGSGKTTVLGELAKLGFPHAPEVARQIIKEQVQANGKALPWIDREAFTRLMLQRSIQAYLEHAPARRPVFSDRGIPDTLGYARLIGLPDTCAIESACRYYRYAPLVFLAPPWKEIYETDNERKQDFAEAERTFNEVARAYRQCGYDLIELPKLPPPARAQVILEKLRSHRLSGTGMCHPGVSMRDPEIIEAELMEISAIADDTLKLERIIAWCASHPDEIPFALHQLIDRLYKPKQT